LLRRFEKGRLSIPGLPVLEHHFHAYDVHQVGIGSSDSPALYLLRQLTAETQGVQALAVHLICRDFAAVFAPAVVLPFADCRTWTKKHDSAERFVRR
jgi:hypothetical protein